MHEYGILASEPFLGGGNFLPPFITSRKLLTSPVTPIRVLHAMVLGSLVAGSFFNFTFESKPHTGTQMVSNSSTDVNQISVSVVFMHPSKT